MSRKITPDGILVTLLANQVHLMEAVAALCADSRHPATFKAGGFLALMAQRTRQDYEMPDKP